ncbi:MAG TPA: amino acid permease [Allosphingosinicella sp.]|nr:amino acid permease [Allosphingosinicella sp.]
MFGPLKPLDGAALHEEDRTLRKTLSWPHLVALGVGAIVGTGIYTLTGVGADRAGPAVILAFAIAGAVCACAALAYAELATLIPTAGSAYTYTYSVVGEAAAWIVGWSLILEYSLACSTVAVGWSAYLVGWIQATGVQLPAAFLSGPHAGGILNVPAILVALAVAGMLIAGTRQSATFNILLVVIKLTALAAFVLLALPAFDAGRLTPFAPYGLGSVPDAEGTTRGVMAAAAIVFFAFYGFDAVATSAEEAKRPGRDLTIGIIGSMAVCTIIYMLVAISAVGAVDWRLVARSSEPLAFVLRTLEHPLAANLVALAALVALPSVILVMMYGQSRIFFVMARDGLLPRKLSEVSPRTGAPVLITAVTGLFVAAAAGLFRLDEIAELANAGTLLAFIAVAACMMILRRTRPDLKRVFRCPAPFLVGTLAILGCAYLIFSLPAATLVRFLIWNAIGLAVYLAYGRTRSLAGRDRPVTGI